MRNRWQPLVAAVAALALLVLGAPAGQAADLHAGSPDPGFARTTAGANGDVDVVTQTGGGKLLVGGRFDSYRGVRNSGLMRLNPDGSPDTGFALPGLGFTGGVLALAVQPDGKILAGGDFDTFNGATVPFLIRLNPDGSRDATFNPGGVGPDSTVKALALQPDGKIIVGGDFTAYNTVVAQRLVRLNPDGTRDATFTQTGAGLNESVEAVLVQPDGNILAGGEFTKYDAADAPRLIRVTTSGSRDGSFTLTGTGLNSTVSAIALQPGGKILAGGLFNLYNGSPAQRLVRLNATGSRDGSFSLAGTGIGGGVLELAVQPDGMVMVGGFFSDFNGSPAHNLLRLTSTGSRDATFQPTGFGLDREVHTLSLRADGTMIAGGQFTLLNGADAPHLVALQSDGSIAPGFTTHGDGLDDGVSALATQPDGKILVGGSFTHYNGVPANNLLRLNPDGTPDPSFSLPGSGFDRTVADIVVQPDGRILVAGDFQFLDDAPTPRLVRLNPDGSRDTTFTQPGSGFNDLVDSLALQDNGKIIAAGYFDDYNGISAPSVLRLNEDGSRDNTFTQTGSGLNGEVESLVLLPDGRLLLGGQFTAYNGTPTPHLIRLNNDGTRDNTFTQTGSGVSGGVVYSVAAQPDGKVLAGGDFTKFDGGDANCLLRLNADGSRDNTFNQAGSGLDNMVFTIGVQADGKILVGGLFRLFNGASASHLIRFNPDGSRDTGFTLDGTGFNQAVFVVQQQPDGLILVGGDFTLYDTTPYASITRLLDKVVTPGPTPTPPGPTPVLPGKPKAVKVKATARKLSVRWKAATGASRYTVKATGKSPKRKPVKKTKSTTRTKTTIKARLKVRSRVKVCVRAKNPVGASPKACVSKKVKRG